MGKAKNLSNLRTRLNFLEDYYIPIGENSKPKETTS